MSLTPRREQVLSLSLVAPAFAYLGVRLLAGYTGWDVTSAVGFLLIPLLLILGLIPLWGPFVELVGFTGVTLVFLDTALTSPSGSTGIDFAAGILLATPFLLGSWTWTSNRSAPARLMGLGLALLEGIILLAALRLLQANGETESAASLFNNYVTVNLLQVCGIAGFLNAVPQGCPTDLSFLPLRDLVDPVFVLLAGLALLGVLLPVLSPRTARGVLGDAESVEEFEESARVAADLAVPAEMMRGLARRTPPRPAPGMAPPGSGALLLSALITLGFVVAAVSTPTSLLLPTMLLLFLSLVAVLLLARPAGSARVARARRLGPAPAPAVGPAPPAAPPAPGPDGGATAPAPPPASGSFGSPHPVLP